MTASQKALFPQLSPEVPSYFCELPKEAQALIIQELDRVKAWPLAVIYLRIGHTARWSNVIVALAELATKPQYSDENESGLHQTDLDNLREVLSLIRQALVHKEGHDLPDVFYVDEIEREREQREEE